MLTAQMRERMYGWKFQSPEENGFHKVIESSVADCRVINVSRLNLSQGEKFELRDSELELNAVVIAGSCEIRQSDFGCLTFKKFDSFYIPHGATVEITAIDSCIFYIAGAPCDGIGEPSYRIYDPDLPIGDIHQVHGAGLGRREVSFTLDPGTKASRLICGITFGATGAWTSWPPHQHEKDLEEAYCYFDMPSPKCGFHVSYLESGKLEDAVVHPVHSGSMVIAPRGYHPTCASPSCHNSYFWALAAFTHESRRYDLAILDEAYEKY